MACEDPAKLLNNKKWFCQTDLKTRFATYMHCLN